MYYHKYSLSEIENMLVFDRDIYVAFIQNYVEEENKNGFE